MSVAEPHLILVDAQDNEMGTLPKLAAHQQGLLHRAFSVFITRRNAEGETEILLQQRAQDKYHCGGLWTNTCCSHPRPGETTQAAAERRLREELGFTVPLTPKGHFIYRAEFSNGLIEHELDHVFVGHFPTNGVIKANPEEVQATVWTTLPALNTQLEQNPNDYTPWLAQALNLAFK